MEQFDNQVKNVIESIKLDKSETNKEEKFKNVLDYAKDFKVKVDEKINCEKELNDCTDALSLLKVPNPPNVSDMSEIEYEKQFDIYTKLFEQYSREKEILGKREEMLSRKLDSYNALLDSMFLYDV